MKRIVSLYLFLLATHAGFSQHIDSSQRVMQLDEVVISANKFEDKKRNVPQKIDIISSGYIFKMNTQNTGDLLMSTGNVFVQKSQQGGSSPVLRGFEANRVSMIIDGVRLNNLIYRAGHLQNVITVDQNMLDRIEVIYGSASTLYGSDALGGVMNFRTKPANPAEKGKLFTPSGLAFVRFSTANKERTAHMDVNLGWKRLAWLQSVTYSDFGNMKMGSDYPNKYPDFGRRGEYVMTVNRVDSIVKSGDDRVQKFSGYKQWDILEKLLFIQNDKIQHSLNLQLSNSTDIPRYDRLQDVRNGKLRYADWYYGPQKRQLYAYELHAKHLTGFFNEIRLNLNQQFIQESRQTREYRKYDQFDSRVEKVKVLGFVLDGRKIFGNNELITGIDGQLNDLKSSATRKNLNTGEIIKLDTRYPDGKNRMNYFGLFGQYSYKMPDGKLVLNGGIRFQSIHLYSSLVDNSFFHLPYAEIKQDNFSITGNAGLVYLPDKSTKISAVISNGFRTPNVDDNSKIFESSTSAQQLVVPNADLKPEYTYNIDLGFNKVMAEKFRFELTGFYTWFLNVIVKAPFKFNGQDSINYNGTMSQVLANQNHNKGYLYGLSASITEEIDEHFYASASVNYTRGRYRTNANELSNSFLKRQDGSYIDSFSAVKTKPLDHIPPVFGKFSIQYLQKNFSAELSILFNGWKHIKDFNADGEDNAQYAAPDGFVPKKIIPDGFPSWHIINWRGSYLILKNLSVQIAVENILDRNYRHFASGFSGAGRNFIITCRFSF